MKNSKETTSTFQSYNICILKSLLSDARYSGRWL